MQLTAVHVYIPLLLLLFQLQRMQADYWFAWQRLNGVTRNLIQAVAAVPQRQV